jgi:hypothetical protein
MVNEVDADQDTTELDGEIEAVRAQLNRLNSRKNQSKPQRPFQNYGGSGQRSSNQSSKPNTNFKDVTCRVCKKKGHF